MSQQDIGSNRHHVRQQCKEIAELIVAFENVEQTTGIISKGLATEEVLLKLSKAIHILRQGELFNPEPHPESGQGKWKELARMTSRTSDFYQSVVIEVGIILGEEAYTADDGKIGDSVLVLKVPKLVEKLKEQSESLKKFNN